MTSLDQRALDHFVIAVSDLETAGRAWEQLGFQVLPRMLHLDSGSNNRVFQLGNTYLELLGDIDRMRNPTYLEHYSRRLTYGSGLANICFTSQNLVGDAAALAKAGVKVGPVGSARRPVVMPDGRIEETASNFFYVSREAGHDFMTPFLAAHGRPEIIFIPEYQVHPNTARDIVGVTCFSAQPEVDARFFATMSGGEVSVIADGARLSLAKGHVVDIRLPAAMERSFGQALPTMDLGSGGFAVGLTVQVDSLSKCRTALDPNVSVIIGDGFILIPASDVLGCFVQFVEALQRS